MNRIVLGNIVALVASLVMVCAGIVKEKKKILQLQIIEIGLFIVSQLILNSIPGIIMNFISIIGNLLYYFDKLKKVQKIIITIVSITATLFINNLGWVGFLPMICVVTYLWLIDLKNIIHFKLLIVFVLTLWIIHDYTIQSYTSVLFDIATIVASFISIYKICNAKTKGIELNIQKKGVV